MYAVLIIDYIFSFRQEERNKINIILGIVIIALMLFYMCFKGSVSNSTVSFVWYPTKLIDNGAHYSGFMVGIVVELIVQTTRTLAAKGKIK